MVQHKELAEGRWNNFILAQQMANIGAEVGRAINWRRKGKPEDMMLQLINVYTLIFIKKCKKS